MAKTKAKAEGERPIRGFRAYDHEWEEICEMAAERGMKPAPFLRELAREERDRIRRRGEGKKP